MPGKDTTNPARAVYIPEELTDGLPPVKGRTYTTPAMVVPGIVTGAAYADGDALGTKFFIPNLFRVGVNSGTIVTARYFDLDDEGLQVDFHLFASEITGGTDNSAFDPSDDDILKWLDVLSFTTFYNLNSNQVSQWTTPIAMNSLSTGLWCQAEARGALNIAANNIPRISLTVFQD